MRITNKKIRELITEEKNASKMYRKYGFDSIAKQETGHSKFLGKLLKERGK